IFSSNDLKCCQIEEPPVELTQVGSAHLLELRDRAAMIDCIEPERHRYRFGGKYVRKDDVRLKPRSPKELIYLSVIKQRLMDLLEITFRTIWIAMRVPVNVVEVEHGTYDSGAMLQIEPSNTC